jgi:hypothetical protein
MMIHPMIVVRIDSTRGDINAQSNIFPYPDDLIRPRPTRRSAWQGTLRGDHHTIHEKKYRGRSRGTPGWAAHRIDAV